MSTIIITASPRQLDNPTSQLVEAIPSYVSGISNEKIVKYNHEFLENEKEIFTLQTIILDQTNIA